MTDRTLSARLYGAALVGLLAVATTLAGVGTFVGQRSGDQEKRQFANLPELPRTLEQWRRFPQRFESFVSDNFGFRNALINMDSEISMVLLGRLPSDRVVIGRDDWLYYAAEKSVPLYQNALPLSAGDGERWAHHLRESRDRLAARGIGYAFVAAPDKHTIYPEHMPARILRKDRPSQYTQLAEIAAREGVAFIDLRPVLTAAKTRGQIYWRDDSHWNDLGAAIAYEAILRALPSELGLVPQVFGDDAFAPTLQGPGDLAQLARLDRQETVPTLRAGRLACPFAPIDVGGSEPGRSPHARTLCPSGRQKLLLFRDSFSSALLPYLAAGFHEVISVWEQPTLDRLMAEVEAEKPDFVLEERAERSINNVP